MPLHPQAKAIVEAFNAMMAGQGPRTPQNLPAARAAAARATRPPGPALPSVRDVCVPGPAGDLLVRVYLPSTASALPVMLYFHGGGWVLGSVDGHDATCRRLALGSGCAVASVEYRLAPEAKFPAPLEDCFAATKWLVGNGGAIGVDGSRLTVGGDSAGGNLAAAVCLMARDQGGPPIKFQMLVYPVMDRDFDTPSYLQNAEGYLLSRAGMIANWKLYLRSDADAANPLAAPLRARDLRGLPPALVITAEYDPLRDEGEAYARRLQASGVPTTLTRYDGMVHGFFGYAETVDAARDAVRRCAEALRKAL